MLNKFCRNFGIYEDIRRNMIRLSKEEYYRNSHANLRTIASKRKGKDLIILTFFCACAGHGTNSVGDSLTTGIYRQV